MFARRLHAVRRCLHDTQQRAERRTLSEIDLELDAIAGHASAHEHGPALAAHLHVPDCVPAVRERRQQD
jgi:hypothetical protein